MKNIFFFLEVNWTPRIILRFLHNIMLIQNCNCFVSQFKCILFFVCYQELLEKIVEQMKRKDPTFQALYKEPQYAGSYYENLRVGHPDEFDINLELELPVKPENIQVSDSLLFFLLSRC